MAGPHALSRLNATTSAANGFKFGATANMNAPQNHRVTHILTTLLISNICDEFSIRLGTKV